MGTLLKYKKMNNFVYLALVGSISTIQLN